MRNTKAYSEEYPEMYISTTSPLTALTWYEVYKIRFNTEPVFYQLRAQETGDATYISPPPDYLPIRGKVAIEKNVKTNLMSSFVCMGPSSTFGTVLSLVEMRDA
ncbi:hypothetical protein AX17_005089 [Amanita inopinata Kibby_2008]|nr:hypothetical protein AX17_005089 [Amanita inopinata Kibby_2008]